MKRSISIVCSFALLAAIGCSGSPETASLTTTDDTAQATATDVASETVPDTVPGDGEALTLVSLKVPNMH